MSIDVLTITLDILSLIAEIDEFKGAWRALGQLAPKRLTALKKVATIVSIGSSTRIEGSKLDDRKSRGRTTISEVVTLTKANRNTVKKHLEALVEKNNLHQIGLHRGTTYGIRL